MGAQSEVHSEESRLYRIPARRVAPRRPHACLVLWKRDVFCSWILDLEAILNCQTEQTVLARKVTFLNCSCLLSVEIMGVELCFKTNQINVALSTQIRYIVTKSKTYWCLCKVYCNYILMYGWIVNTVETVKHPIEVPFWNFNNSTGIHCYRLIDCV